MSWQSFVQPGQVGWTKLEPGMLIKLKDGRVALVGTVNTVLGICDDCTDFDESSIVEFCRIALPCKVHAYV